MVSLGLLSISETLVEAELLFLVVRDSQERSHVCENLDTKSNASCKENTKAFSR